MAEEYVGEPGHSSIRSEGSPRDTKPATDVLRVRGRLRPETAEPSPEDESAHVSVRAPSILRVHGTGLGSAP